MSIIDEIIIRTKKPFDCGMSNSANGCMRTTDWAVWVLDGLDDDGNLRCLSIMSRSKPLGVLIWEDLPDLTQLLRPASAVYYVHEHGMVSPHYNATATTSLPTEKRVVDAVVDHLNYVFRINKMRYAAVV